MAQNTRNSDALSWTFSVRWLDRYMAVPFRDHGRDFSGCDCFGLYLLLLAQEAKLKLSDPGVSFGANPRAVSRAVEREIASGRWMRVAEGDGRFLKSMARRFDCVVMTAHVELNHRLVSADLHIGCALGDGRVIHTEHGAGCQLAELDDPMINNRVRAVHRPYLLA